MEQTRQTLEAQVLERAAKDPEFREQLKQDPQGTFSRDFGIPVPAGNAVDVLEETPTKVYLVLPPAPTQRGQELTAQDLQAVAGGWSTETNAPCGTCDDTCTGICDSSCAASRRNRELSVRRDEDHAATLHRTERFRELVGQLC